MDLPVPGLLFAESPRKKGCGSADWQFAGLGYVPVASLKSLE